ncbi:SDR family NAD(P)-dependent oxidoreductase [Sphingobium sp. CECT 9361]|uniref:SDR family NAD(P)-dependent oxidoreductase n=1 Tax=Sphingobium sp. CECT 9361 TaxID=2845384 RepID=UPI001E5540AE|nr:SDR family NAD(P)-dependent oxidoreductase [Sphingobium sp. CECT 9361]CAH0349221.1 3-oxoacyl-[acyl-carrier-protein] reductase FabG [Sphingobium sp. CECT 9361]
MTAGLRPAALVTGAATGIGRAIAVALAQGGFDVAINYSRSEGPARETEALVRKAGAQRSAVIEADVSNEADVIAMMKDVEALFGPGLDLLVNNAGTTSEVPPHKFDTMTVEDFDRVFAVNVRGTFLVTKHATPLLRALCKANIVNTASIVGLRPGPQPLPYSSSKAAIISMTRTFAGALGPAIRVNAVAPGWLEGEWMERTLGDNYHRLMERRAKQTPLKRCATPEDVGEAVLTLATCLPFTTGQTVVVDGGYSFVS